MKVPQTAVTMKSWHQVQPRAAKRLKKELQESMRKIKEELATLRSMMPRALPDNLMDHLTGLMRCCICQVVPIRPANAVDPSLVASSVYSSWLTTKNLSEETLHDQFSRNPHLVHTLCKSHLVEAPLLEICQDMWEFVSPMFPQ